MRPLPTLFVLSVGRVVALVATLCGLGMTGALSAEWPHLRGPALDGSAPDEAVSTRWPEQGPPVLWKRSVGQGYAAFTVSGDRAYTLYQSAFAQSLVCLDANTGQTVWEFACGSPFEPLGLYPGPRSTPTLAGGRALFVTPDSLLHCVDAKRGKGLWSVDLKGAFSGKGTEFGYSASPLVLGEKVIVPVGGRDAAVVAFSLENGALLWRSGTQPASYASIVPIRLEGRTLLLAAMRNHLLLLEPDTGRIAWETEVSQGYDEHSISPLYEEPILVLTAPFKAGATAFRLSLQKTPDAATPDENGVPGRSASGDADVWSIRADHLWHSREFSNDVLASAVVDGTIYGFDLRDQQAKAHRPSRGLFRCLDLATGKTLWSSDRPGHSNVLPLRRSGNLLLFNDEGELIVLRANREAYEELARHPVFEDEICWTSPAVSDGRVFLRTQSRAAAVRIGPASAEPDGVLAASPGPAPVSTRRFWSLFRLGTLLGGEREHPFMQPASDELWRWFSWSLAVVALPACVWASLARWRRKLNSRLDEPLAPPNGAENDRSSVVLPSHLVEAGLWIVLGLGMTPILNLQLSRLETVEGHDPFVLTWPAALFGGLLLVGLTGHFRNPWIRRGGDIGFLLLCLLYFLVLRSQSLPHEWAFLIGLVPAVPFAWGWSRSKIRESEVGRWSSQALVGSLLATLGFAVLFWTPLALRILRGSLVEIPE